MPTGNTAAPRRIALLFLALTLAAGLLGAVQEVRAGGRPLLFLALFAGVMLLAALPPLLIALRRARAGLGVDPATGTVTIRIAGGLRLTETVLPLATVDTVVLREEAVTGYRPARDELGALASLLSGRATRTVPAIALRTTEGDVPVLPGRLGGPDLQGALLVAREAAAALGCPLARPAEIVCRP